jgi:hypothetical protein
MTNRDTVKGYFETGDYPTQAQFWDLFDKLFFKDEFFVASRIRGTGVGQIDIPEDTWIDKIGIVGNSAIVVSIGTYPGGNDVLDNQAMNSTQGFNTDVYFEAAGTLYITGIVPTTKLIIFTR